MNNELSKMIEQEKSVIEQEKLAIDFSKDI